MMPEKISICLISDRMESSGDDDVSIVSYRSRPQVRDGWDDIKQENSRRDHLGWFCYTYYLWFSCWRKIYLFYFYFICHTIITKSIGDLTETIGAYERLGLLELWARAVSYQLKKRRRKVEDGKTYELFSYLFNNLIFSFFLKEERDWELMILLSSELKNLGPWKKGENFFVFVRQYGRR